MFDDVVRPAVSTLATYYAGQGIDGATAAKRAVDEIIGQKYDVSGSLRTPKGMMGQVQSAGDYMLSNLKQSDIAPNNASLAQARNGTWATLPDGSGVALMAKSTQGGYVPVRGANGSYISMKFNNLPKPPTAAPGAVDPAMTIGAP